MSHILYDVSVVVSYKNNLQKYKKDLIYANISCIFMVCIEKVAFFLFISEICSIFAGKLRENKINITMEMDNNWSKIRKVLINKYAIALYVFALLFMFFGDHSLVKYLKRAKKMRALEEQLEVTRHEIEQSESVMRVLDNVDSLERFAREQYRMHAPNEDVYVVEE